MSSIRPGELIAATTDRSHKFQAPEMLQPGTKFPSEEAALDLYQGLVMLGGQRRYASSNVSIKLVPLPSCELTSMPAR